MLSRIGQAFLERVSETKQNGRRKYYNRYLNLIGFRDLSTKSSFFRNKLIQEFNIIESLDATSQGSRYTTRDFMDPDIRSKLLLECPSAVVWFPGIKRKPATGIQVDRRLVRTKGSYFVSPGAWAAWIIQRILY
jgi:hypothetical protein